LLVVIESIVQGFIPSFSFNFLGGLYTAITFTQDLFGVLVLLGVLIAAIRRFLVRVKRLHTEKDGNFDAAFILTLISIVIISMFGQNIHSLHSDIYSFRFVSDFIRESFEIKKSYINYEYFWWIHIITILTFLN
jgi:hypothetical protein